jgi:hypothetical protein
LLSLACFFRRRDQGDDFLALQSTGDFREIIIRNPDADRRPLKFFAALHVSKALASFGEDRGQRQCQHICGTLQGNAQIGGHAGAYAGSFIVLHHDLRGKSLWCRF